MRKLTICLALAPLLGACLDAIGPGGDCTPEMRSALSTHGQPISTQRNSGVDSWERWRYDDFVIEFRWGASYDGCQVTSSALNLMPLLPFF